MGHIITFYDIVCYFLLILNTSSAEEEQRAETSTHHRVRRFAFSRNSRVAFDVNLDLPIPMMSGVDMMAKIEIPFVITMMNDTFVLNPITIPYAVFPQRAPIVMPASFPAFMPSFYPNKLPFDDANIASFASLNPKAFYGYHILKRSIRAASAQHRYDLFSTLSEILDEFGIDGKACISKAICQLAHTPLLIETPFHEIMEHLLTVSRAIDEEALLEGYLEAEEFGRKDGNCTELYSTCIFNLFTSVDASDLLDIP